MSAERPIPLRRNVAAELGVPPEKEDALERWERMMPKPEPESRERQLDTRPPTMAEIDDLIGQRIDAEHEFIIAIMAEVVAQLQREAPAGPPGPPGPPRPPGPPGTPGKLPIAKIWRQDSVTYEAQVVCYDGSLYQALKDTAQVPGGSDWICLAVAGRDAITPQVRGTYKNDEQYKKLDVCAFNGASFIARHDDPGECPGRGWQLLASRGKTGDKGLPGPRGEKGPQGEQGPPGPIVTAWEIDHANYRARAIMSDGSDGGTLDLRSLFEQFHTEAR